jgi:hypothetical protein
MLRKFEQNLLKAVYQQEIWTVCLSEGSLLAVPN